MDELTVLKLLFSENEEDRLIANEFIQNDDNLKRYFIIRPYFKSDWDIYHISDEDTFVWFYHGTSGIRSIKMDKE